MPPFQSSSPSSPPSRPRPAPVTLRRAIAVFALSFAATFLVAALTDGGSYADAAWRALVTAAVVTVAGALYYWFRDRRST